MNIIQDPDEWTNRPSRVCLAIGFFDGVHLGHQQVIRQALDDAGQGESEAVAVTFDPHPATVIAPERAPALVYSLERKLATLAGLGVRHTLLLHFDETLCRQSGEAFVRGLQSHWEGIDSICVGNQFRFGHRREGNVALLRRMGEDIGFAVHGLAAVALDGEPVSSTRIRASIRQGDFGKAGQMLGRPYRLVGRVVEGDRLGRQLGFPTANLDVTGLVLPPAGVYAVHLVWKGREHRGVLNIGVRPTLQSATPAVRVEAHLLDFDGDLYGELLEVGFIRHIRDERAFPTLDALKEQIRNDIGFARESFPGP